MAWSDQMGGPGHFLDRVPPKRIVSKLLILAQNYVVPHIRRRRPGRGSRGQQIRCTWDERLRIPRAFRAQPALNDGRRWRSDHRARVRTICPGFQHVGCMPLALPRLLRLPVSQGEAASGFFGMQQFWLPLIRRSPGEALISRGGFLL